jgi:hypothetical protein
MSKLTPSERTTIIAKHLSGQPNSEYDVITTKSGKFQCRKRVEQRESLKPTESVKVAEPDDRFDPRKLIEKMYQRLTKEENTKNKHEITLQPEREVEPPHIPVLQHNAGPKH